MFVLEQIGHGVTVGYMQIAVSIWVFLAFQNQIDRFYQILIFIRAEEALTSGPFCHGAIELHRPIPLRTGPRIWLLTQLGPC